MSPEPNVRGQALVLAVALIAAAVLGSPIAALALSLAGGAVAWGLQTRYRGDLAVAGLAVPPHHLDDVRPQPPVPPHRDRLDRVVAGDVRAALAVGATASAVMIGFAIEAIDVGAAAATPVLVAGAALGVLLSSLFDWYVILPRISGLLGPRPCREPAGRFRRWPTTWRTTTRWWYIHRLVAVIVLWYGISYAIVLSLDEQLSLFGGKTVVTGAALGFLASYRKAVPRVAMQAMHPTMIVGQTVQRRAVIRRWRRVRWRRRVLPLPWWARRPIGAPGEREYVYDVAVEGVNVVEAGRRETQGRESAAPNRFVDHPTKVELKDIGWSKQATIPFAGCQERCSGINWYCIDNPRCFQEK